MQEYGRIFGRMGRIFWPYARAIHIWPQHMAIFSESVRPYGFEKKTAAAYGHRIRPYGQKYDHAAIYTGIWPYVRTYGHIYGHTVIFFDPQWICRGLSSLKKHSKTKKPHRPSDPAAMITWANVRSLTVSQQVKELIERQLTEQQKPKAQKTTKQLEPAILYVFERRRQELRTLSPRQIGKYSGLVCVVAHGDASASDVERATDLFVEGVSFFLSFLDSGVFFFADFASQANGPFE
jgi:hypothetical protein